MPDFALRNDADRARLLGYISGLDLEKAKKVSVRDADRSSAANALLHLRLTEIANQVLWQGQRFSVEVWKRLCTAAWLREEGEQPMLVPALDGNGFDLVHQRTSKLTVKQCASLITWCEMFAAENGVKLSAQDNWGGRY